MRPRSLCFASAAAALVLAGCGGASTTERGHAAPAKAAPADAGRIGAFKAALAFARCMRAHGVAHPNPDRDGDFHLTPAQERRMRASATPREHEAAEQSCFHHLKNTVSTEPLSASARRAALVPLRDLRRCMHGFGYEFGKPTVQNMSLGRAKFGFDTGPSVPPTAQARTKLTRAQHTCETRVKLAQRLDAIIKADRADY